MARIRSSSRARPRHPRTSTIPCTRRSDPRLGRLLLAGRHRHVWSSDVACHDPPRLSPSYSVAWHTASQAWHMSPAVRHEPLSVWPVCVPCLTLASRQLFGRLPLLRCEPAPVARVQTNLTPEVDGGGREHSPQCSARKEPRLGSSSRILASSESAKGRRRRP